MRRLAVPALFVLGSLLAPPAASAVGITLIPGSPDSFILQNPDVPDSQGVLELTSFPDSGTLVSAPGATTATTYYSLSTSAFEITFDQSVALAPADLIVFIAFIPDMNVDYVLDGAYAATDPEGIRDMFMLVALGDATETQGSLFQNGQESRHTPNESFVLGGLGGDSNNQLQGSLTGTLLAGHEYTFFISLGLESITPVLPRRPRRRPVS